MSVKMPKFEIGDATAIPSQCKQVRDSFLSHKTRPLEFRLKQLRKLWWGLKDNEAQIIQACTSDLGKPVYETVQAEWLWCMNDIVHTCDNLESWAKDTRGEADLVNSFASPTIRKDPMGTVLIIGAFNFPFQLSLGPLIGAMAAGCTAILKPSENSPASAAVMENILQRYVDTSCYRVIQGGIPETTALLNEKWDKIFYTGNGTVGTIISKKAAETLTPVVLELGGKNPAIVTKNADVKLAARRLMWAKTMNAGQVCMSHNYALVQKEVLPTFLEGLKQTQKEFWPSGTKNSPDYGKIVNNRQWTRLKKMLDTSKGKILMGGGMDEATHYLEPTVVQVDSIEDSLMSDESFGPLMPVMPFNTLDEAIKIANQVDPTPLGCYPFGSSAEMKRMLAEMRSGGATCQDGFFHGCIPTTPFGGVGSSGTGAYRGKASFDVFTHFRTIAHTPAFIETFLTLRYPPFHNKKLAAYKSVSMLAANFDRSGNESYGILRLILTLGGGRINKAWPRWLVVLLLTAYLKRAKAWDIWAYYMISTQWG